jgi:hypothetical protein
VRPPELRASRRGLDRDAPDLEEFMGRLIGIIIIVWLLIGVVAAAQRGYFGNSSDVSCKQFGDTALTIVAGPLNYVGINPKIDCSNINTPQPSS